METTQDQLSSSDPAAQPATLDPRSAAGALRSLTLPPPPRPPDRPNGAGDGRVSSQVSSDGHSPRRGSGVPVPRSPRAKAPASSELDPHRGVAFLLPTSLRSRLLAAAGESHGSKADIILDAVSSYFDEVAAGAAARSKKPVLDPVLGITRRRRPPKTVTATYQQRAWLTVAEHDALKSLAARAEMSMSGLVAACLDRYLPADPPTRP